MVVLGVLLLVLGFVLAIKLLWIIGIVLLAVGALVALLGLVGHGVGGRSHWY